jgi:GNAT superfamily N-acetyltransferase
VGGPDLEPLLRYWRAQDDLFDATEPAWWGAVVSDARYPAIQEPNYARVESHEPVGLDEVEGVLLPSMAASGSRRAHVVIFRPEDQTDLIAQAGTRGERITWDLVMEHPGAGPPTDPHPPGGSDEPGPVEEIVRFDDRFWSAHRASMRWFDIAERDVVDQLQAIERDVLIPAGRRWFAAGGDDGLAALAALLVLEGVAYLDHVVTVPEARRRGFASALTRRAIAEASAAGAPRVYLLAEPDAIAVGMYERIGFRAVTQIASWISPIPGA